MVCEGGSDGGSGMSAVGWNGGSGVECGRWGGM